jgi:hypothetical protein
MPKLNVRLDDETHAMLVAQAGANLRSANAQIAWLIRNADQSTIDVAMTTVRCYMCGAPQSSRDTGWQRYVVHGERRDVCPDRRRHALLAKEGLPAWGAEAKENPS